MRRRFNVLASALLVPGLLLAIAGPAAAVNNQMYFGYVGGSILWLPTPNTPENITGLALPAGKYWVTVTATLNGSTDMVTGTGRTLCALSEDGDFVEDEAAFDFDANTNAQSVKALFLTALIDWNVPFQATLRCVSSGSTAINFENVRISAVAGVTSGPGGPKLRGTTTQARNVAGDSAFHTIATLSLSAGRWLVTGKSNFQNWPSTAGAEVSCRLKFSASDRDQTSESLAPVDARGYEGEVAVQAGHAFASPATAKLQCKTNQPIVTDYNQLVAVKAGSLSRTPLGATTTTNGTGTPIVSTAYGAAGVAIPAGATYTTVASIALPDGWWQVQAKATLNATGNNRVDCRLLVSDVSDFRISYGGIGAGRTGMYLQDAGIRSGGSPALLQCIAAYPGASLTDLRITALSVSGITYEGLTN